MTNDDRKYVNFTLPKKIGESMSRRDYTTSDGKEMVELTLPGHTNVTLPTGEAMDASFHKLRVPKSCVREFDNDPTNFSIGVPLANAEGEPWRVDLIKQQGCWEHPEAEGADRGRYIVYSTQKISLDSEGFAQDMQAARDERKAWAQEHGKEKAPTLKEEGKKARAASEQLAKDAKSAPVKSKAKEAAAK